MVTRPEYYSNGLYFGAETFFGLSTDTKPTDCGNGSAFIEMDASAIWFYDASTGDWLEWGAEAAANDALDSAEEKQKEEVKTDADDPGSAEEKQKEEVKTDADDPEGLD